MFTKKERVKTNELSKGNYLLYQYYRSFNFNAETQEDVDELKQLYDNILSELTAIIINSKDTAMMHNVNNYILKDQDKRLLINMPSISGIVYINSPSSAPHFHVDNMNIFDAEAIGYIKSLPRQFRYAWFDKWFIDKNIREAYIILRQMGALKDDGELSVTIKNYEERLKIRNSFLTEVLENIILLTKEDNPELTKAHFFADLFDVDFEKTEQQMKLIKK